MHRPHLDFALALHRELPTGSNLVWSPYSVAAALGLATAGARGRTRNELVKVLAPGGELTELARVLSDSTELPEAESAVANALWLRPDLVVEPAFRGTVDSWPGGAWHTGDFRRDPEQVRKEINDDVASITRDLVRDLLAPGTVSRQTAAVIVNALYLKVAWQLPFRPAATRPADFHAPAGVRQLPTMRQQERLGYAAADGWRMVTLPTATDVAVDVLLPDPPNGALSTEPAPPSRETLTTLYGASRSRSVELALPRFKVSAGALLNQPLAQLGAITAFGAEADFSGLTTTEQIRIDRVVHKAVLTVDEAGFEGAAATALVMRTVSMETGTPIRFHVDRPFLLVVRHTRTGAIFFLARVTEPG